MPVDTVLQDMNSADIEVFLNTAPIGHLATVNTAGFPYVTPIHFIYYNNKIYIHGNNKGLKIQNLNLNHKVGFETCEMREVTPADMPCMANTIFTSVIVQGSAALCDNIDVKRAVLQMFVDKYLPVGQYEAMPDKVIAVTGLIEITIASLSAKKRIVKE